MTNYVRSNLRACNLDHLILSAHKFSPARAKILGPRKVLIGPSSGRKVSPTGASLYLPPKSSEMKLLPFFFGCKSNRKIKTVTLEGRGMTSALSIRWKSRFQNALHLLVPRSKSVKYIPKIWTRSRHLRPLLFWRPSSGVSGLLKLENLPLTWMIPKSRRSPNLGRLRPKSTQKGRFCPGHFPEYTTKAKKLSLKSTLCRFQDHAVSRFKINF